MKNKSLKNKILVAVIIVVLLIAAGYYIVPQLNPGQASDAHTIAPIPQGLTTDR